MVLKKGERKNLSVCVCVCVCENGPFEQQLRQKDRLLF